MTLKQNKAVHSDNSSNCPKVIPKLYEEIRADNSTRFYATVSITFKLFSIIPYKKTFYVQETKPKEKYSLTEHKPYTHKFEHFEEAELKLKSCIIDWQKDYLSKKIDEVVEKKLPLTWYL